MQPDLRIVQALAFAWRENHVKLCSHDWNCCTCVDYRLIGVQLDATSERGVWINLTGVLAV